VRAEIAAGARLAHRVSLILADRSKRTGNTTGARIIARIKKASLAASARAAIASRRRVEVILRNHQLRRKVKCLKIRGLGFGG
jgi:hypothetical protein